MMNIRVFCVILTILGTLYAADALTGTDGAVNVTATLRSDVITLADDGVVDVVYSGGKPVSNATVATDSEDVMLRVENIGGGRLKVLLEPLTAGEIEVALRFEYKDEAGVQCVFGIGRVKLTVNSSLTQEHIDALNSGDLSPIINPIAQTDSVESVPRDYRMIAAAAAVGLVILAAGFMIARRKREEKVKQKKFVIVHNVAYQLLDDLKFMNLPHKGEFKLYYANLGNILRYYIEYRFNIHAPDMTTEEFLEKIRYSGQLAGQDKNNVEKFLGICDMVKFAKFEPTIEQAQQAMDTVRAFVGGSEDYQCVIEESIGARFGSILEEV